MPSESYDFFAPLGEFGQPHEHYHQMRRLHLFVNDYGSVLAPLVNSMPAVIPSGDTDTTTLRWAARSNGTSGVVLVNNHERLANLSAKEGVRFHLRLASGAVLSLPSNSSAAVTVQADAWFHWPFNFEVQGVVIAWATAQILCELKGEGLVFFASTDGAASEVAFYAASTKSIVAPGAVVAKEGPFLVVRNITAGFGVAARVIQADGSTLSVVVLPSSAQDRVWKQDVAGVARVVLTDGGLFLANASEVYLRSDQASAELWIVPAPAQLALNGSPLTGVSDGVFSRYTVPLPASPPPTVSFSLYDTAGPARSVPAALSGKAREPNGDEWTAAAKYKVVVSGIPPAETTDLRLWVRYFGDSARFYANATGVLLTDNWFTGYSGDGEMQVGLSYLQAEAGLTGSSEYDLYILPLKESTLQTNVFIENNLWPPFDDGGLALQLLDIVPLQVFKVTLMATQ
jgi:beta-galactosidase